MTAERFKQRVHAIVSRYELATGIINVRRPGQWEYDQADKYRDEAEALLATLAAEVCK